MGGQHILFFPNNGHQHEIGHREIQPNYVVQSILKKHITSGHQSIEKVANVNPWSLHGTLTVQQVHLYEH